MFHSLLLLIIHLSCFKVGLSPSKKNYVICLIESPSKMTKNAFLFYLKSSFCSQDIYVLVTTFWSCRKNGLIRNISLISKFMTSPPGLQAIAIHILPNTPRSQGNQTMKFSQLIEDNKENISFQKLHRK